MNAAADTESFFLSAHHLRDPEKMRLLLASVPLGSPIVYDLTFHASFASKMFALLKREGENIQGFERMQQSLADSVQQVNKLLESAEREYSIDLGIHGTSAALAGFIEDLAELKAWMLEHQSE